ncbi:unnamed protein product [Mucor hiemalis]
MATSENGPPDSVFPYTNEEFISLQQANIAASIISLVFSLFVVLFYIYMLVYHRKKANRVSLRCVFLSSLSEALSSIMSIVVTTDKVRFCNAANIVIGFTSIFSSAALTIVGLNLILIFVINVKRRDVLEKFYYPTLVVYSIIGALAPIYRHIGGNLADNGNYSCWYITYVLVRSQSNFPYIWFYVFVFFTNIVALLCSLIAMIKLLREQRRIKTTNHSSVLKKVVLRCTIYPLVPFISDIFGFIMELMINNGQNPSFTLAMFDVIFSKIEGFLVAIVFFSDPAVTSMMVDGYKSYYQKYVVEYITVTKEELEQIQKKSNSLQAYTASTSSQTAQHSEINKDTNFESCLQASSSIVGDGDHNKRADFQGCKMYGIFKEEKTHTQQDILKSPEVIPIRKVVVPKSGRNEEDSNANTAFHPTLNSSSNVLTNPLVVSKGFDRKEGMTNANKSKEFYVPYRYPFIARVIHGLMCCSGFKSLGGSVSGKEDQSAQHVCVENTSFTNASSSSVEDDREGSTICQSRSSILISKY